jgi:hypothetical protein
MIELKILILSCILKLAFDDHIQEIIPILNNCRIII